MGMGFKNCLGGFETTEGFCQTFVPNPRPHVNTERERGSSNCFRDVTSEFSCNSTEFGHSYISRFNLEIVCRRGKVDRVRFCE